MRGEDTFLPACPWPSSRERTGQSRIFHGEIGGTCRRSVVIVPNCEPRAWILRCHPQARVKFFSPSTLPACGRLAYRPPPARNGPRGSQASIDRLRSAQAIPSTIPLARDAMAGDHIDDLCDARPTAARERSDPAAGPDLGTIPSGLCVISESQPTDWKGFPASSHAAASQPFPAFRLPVCARTRASRRRVRASPPQLAPCHLCRRSAGPAALRPLIEKTQAPTATFRGRRVTGAEGVDGHL